MAISHRDLALIMTLGPAQNRDAGAAQLEASVDAWLTTRPPCKSGTELTYPLPFWAVREPSVVSEIMERYRRTGWHNVSMQMRSDSMHLVFVF